MSRRSLLGALLTALALAACSAPAPREPAAPPRIDYEAAEIEGFPNVRIFYDTAHTVPDELRLRYLDQRLRARLPRDRFTVLALSGGGPDGAFGAGFLKGWSETGERPSFDIVTGISTGALMAPHAFLGPDFDAELARFYTDTTTQDVLTLTLFSALSGGASVADTGPLRRQLEAAVTPALVEAIAAEHRRGRRLLVGTTHMDAQRPVVWDIGAIANSGNPAAPDLIRRIMLASASIPGVFPPVLFDVTVNGERHTELHADGGVTLSIFAYPRVIDLGHVVEALGVPPAGRTFYLIRNAKLQPEYLPLELALLPIAGRAVSTLIKYQTIGSLVEIEELARRDGFGVKLAFVPDAFSVTAKELFDPAYMRALYELGYEQAREGYKWAPSVFGTAP